VVALAAGHFRHTSKLDLAVVDGRSGLIAVLPGNGNGTFGDPRTINNERRGVAAVAAADFRGNGRADIAVVDFAGLSVLLDNGDGTFQPSVSYGGGAGDTEFGAGLVVADFDNDHRPDVAIASTFVAVFRGNGDGTFENPRYVGYGVSAAAADVNGDGNLDLVTGDYDAVTVLLGDGAGTFRPENRYIAGNEPVAVATGDLTGAGLPDVVAVNLASGNVAVLHNAGDWPPGPPGSGSPAPSPPGEFGGHLPPGGDSFAASADRGRSNSDVPPRASAVERLWAARPLEGTRLDPFLVSSRPRAPGPHGWQHLSVALNEDVENA
jgi:hypothetical protein